MVTSSVRLSTARDEFSEVAYQWYVLCSAILLLGMTFSTLPLLTAIRGMTAGTDSFLAVLLMFLGSGGLLGLGYIVGALLLMWVITWWQNHPVRY